MSSSRLGFARALQHPHARAALARTPIIDGHNDLAWELRVKADYSVEGLDGVHTSSPFQTDLSRLTSAGVGGQFWSVYVDSTLPEPEALVATLEQIDCVHRLIEQYPDDLAFAWSAEQVRSAWAAGRIASLLGAEGGAGINNSLGVLRMLAKLGVRYLTLTHNYTLDWADSATDEARHGGLTDFGREVVRELNRLGMLVDLSHVSADAMHDALDVSSAPVIFSHSCCRAVCEHPRNVPDDVLERLPGNGGVLMVAFVPPFLTNEDAKWHDEGDLSVPKPVVTPEDVVKHLEHARDLAGIDHLGIGSDYDGYFDFPEGMGDVTGFALVFDQLAEHGWSADDLAKLAGENVLRVLEVADRQAD